MTIKTKSLSGPKLFGYVAEPDAAAQGGVLILPTIFGVNEFARQYADTLASAGMTTAVWDINSGLPLTTDYQECIKRARTLTDQSVSGMVTAWLDTMLSDYRPEVGRGARLLHRRPLRAVAGGARQAAAGLRDGLSIH